MRSDPHLLKSVRSLVRCYARELGYDDDTVDRIVLAVDEACTNAIRHAYHGDEERALSLKLGFDDGSLSIEVGDEGCPAPRERLGKRIEESPAEAGEIKPGGLGIPFMREVFDSVEFEAGEAQGNRVRLRLKQPAHGST